MKTMPSVPARGWAALLVLVLVSACQNPVDTGPSTVRLHNATSVDLTDVYYSAGFPGQTYARIAPGAYTDYVEVPRIYEIVSKLDATAGDKSLHIQIADHVGDEPLRPGRFTQVIYIDAGGYITTRLERDD